MATYIKRTPNGELACSCCGYFIAGNSWQSSKVRGYFCSNACRATCENNINYFEKFNKATYTSELISKAN